MLSRSALAGLLALLTASLGLAEEPRAVAFRPKSLAYVLQADKFAHSRKEAVQKLAASGRDVVVVDASYAGNERWTPTELAKIRAGQAGRRVLAYLSIGEAEDYRGYWHKEWDANKDGHPDAAAPKFLGAVNPDWPGNYRVKYWDAQWQQIMLKELDKVVAQGFDGVYLDIVDGFETYEKDGNDSIDNRPNRETGKTFRQDMVAWVGKIAEHARAKNKGFLVVPQNGAQLVEFPAYLHAIDAVGAEDVFTEGDKKQPAADTKYVLGYLKQVTAQGKSVLLIEYGKRDKARKISLDGAKKHGLALLLTDRELTTLGTAGP